MKPSPSLARLGAESKKSRSGGVEVPPKSIIWRYMSVAKFLSLVVHKSLFFPSLESLRNIDPAEGKHSTHKENARFEAKLRVLAKLAEMEADASIEKKRNQAKELRALQERLSGLTMFASCWYLHSSEDASMWRSYGSEGVAIVSTVEALLSSLSNTKAETHAKAVHYAPPSTDNPLDWAFQKRAAYSSEREFRVVLDFTNRTNDALYENPGWVPGGLYVPCDVGKLVTRAVVAPGKTSWIREALRIATEKLSASIKIEESDVEV